MTNVQEMWAIKNPTGLISSYISFERKLVVRIFCYGIGEMDWKKLYRRGYRAVKIQIREKPKPIIKKVWIGALHEHNLKQGETG